jgi:hypothetical protein
MKNLVFIILMFSLPVNAQNYFKAAGIRGGISSGFTYRQFLEPDLAYEGLLSFRKGGIQFSVLRQRFQPTHWKISEDFFFVYGYGGHVGFTYTDTYKFIFREYYHSDKRFSPLIGMDGYLGLEYHFPALPVQIGLDYLPFFELSVFEFFQVSIWDIAFNIKYTF